MDRVIVKKKWTAKRILTIAGIAAIVMLIAASYYFTSGKPKLNVDAERISIGEIKNSVFQENISVNGVVLPLTSIYLDAQEGGRVEEKYVEDGTIMKKGEPILRLSNTDLLLTLMGTQNTVYNTLTQMQINSNNAQQNTVSKLNQMADVESQLKEAERLYNLNKELYDQKVIGSQEFKQSEINYKYLLDKKKLTRQILEQDSISRLQQAKQDKQSYAGSQQALNIMQKKVGDLIVRAPVDGQLTSLDAEIGENKNKGQRLGQIDVLNGFKVRVDVDEHYLSRIYPGQRGGFTFADSAYVLEIKKVFTQVTNGRFQVDMEFVGKTPKGIRRGQTLQILLALSDERKALLLPRGGFYQTTGGNWIFKVSEDGKRAYRVDIKLGNQNQDYYEVLEGLNPGDKVVTSSYENYGNMQELILK
ncbi:MAG: HlyD family efflux transporter periplasmic adaptor subunit [Sphingobacteriales bacterium]|nr:HlyD family efflux transporter periplasmic adaptor subunit [Sphingobacteriales bacterium]OJY92351.1 MAG: efflux transporter periplasmic adaptor subunit [Sphingobacteriales bacterium 44-15]